jgi:two-component system sensor histidine kinase KdpD
MTDTRQDPDELLAKIRRERDRASRGRLKIFFGASAGVGKTYAMLSSAHELRAQSVDVVVGIAETHGRKDTAALLEGLEVLPPRHVEYRGSRLVELHLDAALVRHPFVILVDELAHNNAPGSRHPKRWQDIEELLDAGINVYTTVNVQHLESLNDVITGITGVKVSETVPDSVFDKADDVTVVDLPSDELLQRLRHGKVYMPAQAERAIQNFFRKGNLIALRELALRRTADRVDAQMLVYRNDQAIGPVWPTRESLVACVGPQPASRSSSMWPGMRSTSKRRSCSGCLTRNAKGFCVCWRLPNGSVRRRLR